MSLRTEHFGLAKLVIAAIGVVIYRFMTSGVIAVYIFFVLSGYVLSVGFIRNRLPSKLADQAARRYLRLTIPIFICSLIAFLAIKLGLMHNQEASVVFGNAWIGGFYRWSPTILEFFRFSLFDVYFNFTDKNLGFVLWTMHVEFFGSIAVLSALALFGSIEKKWVAYLAVFSVFVLLNPALASFFIGMFVAELRARSAFHVFLQSKLLKISISLMLLLAVTTPIAVFHFVYPLAPDLAIYFWITAATVVVVATIGLDPLQVFLENKLSQYLGRVSFPLYLIHPIILCTFSCWYLVLSMQYVGREWAIFSTAALTVLFVLLASSMFAPIDSFAIHQSRKFSAWLMAKSAKGCNPLSRRVAPIERKAR